MAEVWTNAALQSVLTSEGEKIRSIKGPQFQLALYTPLAGYPTLTVDDITLTTVGGTDVIKCRKWSPKLQKYYTEMFATAQIEKIITVEDKDDHLDPYELQY